MAIATRRSGLHPRLPPQPFMSSPSIAPVASTMAPSTASAEDARLAPSPSSSSSSSLSSSLLSSSRSCRSLPWARYTSTVPSSSRVRRRSRRRPRLVRSGGTTCLSERGGRKDRHDGSRSMPPPGLEQSSSENPASFIAITAVSIGWLFRMPAAALMRSECGICLGMMLRDNVWLISDRIGLCEAELLSFWPRTD